MEEQQAPEVVAHSYVCVRDCPFSFNIDPKTGLPASGGVSLYAEGESVNSTLDPLVVPHHFECTDPGVQKLREAKFANDSAEKKRAQAKYELEQVEQSAPMVAAAAIVEKMAELFKGQASPAPAVPTPPQEPAPTEPVGETANSAETGESTDASNDTLTAGVGGEATPGE